MMTNYNGDIFVYTPKFKKFNKVLKQSQMPSLRRFKLLYDILTQHVQDHNKI